MTNTDHFPLSELPIDKEPDRKLWQVLGCSVDNFALLFRTAQCFCIQQDGGLPVTPLAVAFVMQRYNLASCKSKSHQ
ncbi:hypothetical protein TWF173_007849 [Orbilia oligospora]|nr:hypothetical protein TWF173_007849 [Orbilia oligospora]